MRPKSPRNFRRLSIMSFQNIGRNLLLSVATTVMMGLILFIFNVIMVLNFLTQASIDKVNEKVDLILYLSDSATPYQITELTKEIESLPSVTEVEYTSKEKALQEFLTLYPDKADPFTNYGIANPLPANVRIVTEKPEEQGMIVDYLRASSYSGLLLDIESSNENQEIVSRLVKVTNFTEKLIIGVIVTFVFGSLLIIINAIHLSIFTRRREIQIMQLVGARPSMIRFPFIFEGAIYSLVAVVFSFMLLIFFLEGANLDSFSDFKEHWNPLFFFGTELIGSLALGIISSVIAINYYLRKTLVLDQL